MDLPWDGSYLDKKNYQVSKNSIIDLRNEVVIPCISISFYIQLLLSEKIKKFFMIYSLGCHRGCDGDRSKFLRPLQHKGVDLSELYPINEYENYHEYDFEIKSILMQKYLCQIASNTLKNISLFFVDDEVKIISINESGVVKSEKFYMVAHIMEEFFPGPNGLSDGLAEVLEVTDEESYLNRIEELDREVEDLKYDLWRYNKKRFIEKFYDETRRLLDDFYDRKIAVD